MGREDGDGSSEAPDDSRIAVRTLCGSGVRGFADGPGSLAQFDRPVGVLALPDGRLLVADTFNHRIRLVSSQGVVSAARVQVLCLSCVAGEHAVRQWRQGHERRRPARLLLPQLRRDRNGRGQ